MAFYWKHGDIIDDLIPTLEEPDATFDFIINVIVVRAPKSTRTFHCRLEIIQYRPLFLSYPLPQEDINVDFNLIFKFKFLCYFGNIHTRTPTMMILIKNWPGAWLLLFTMGVEFNRWTCSSVITTRRPYVVTSSFRRNLSSQFDCYSPQVL